MQGPNDMFGREPDNCQNDANTLKIKADDETAVGVGVLDPLGCAL
jgi:hypothetical protein